MIYSFKLNKETIKNSLLLSWVVENYPHYYVWNQADIKHKMSQGKCIEFWKEKNINNRKKQTY